MENPRRAVSKSGSIALLAISVLLLLTESSGTDPNCGSAPCSEASTCAAPKVIECSDWDDGTLDGWAESPNPEGNGGIFSGAGLNGSPGWVITIQQGQHGALFFDKSLDRLQIGLGPLHVRFYVKFSEGYIHIPTCGFQKMMFLESTNAVVYWRVMLGVQPAKFLGGSYSNLPDTVGIFGFDYIGHQIEVPNRPGDNPILIYPDQWYCVEISAHWTSRQQNVVKVWVDGVLQMARHDFNDGVWDPAHLFTFVQDSSHYGGDSPDCLPAQTQFVLKDNHVISTGYIGPIGSLALDDSQ